MTKGQIGIRQFFTCLHKEIEQPWRYYKEKLEFSSAQQNVTFQDHGINKLNRRFIWLNRHVLTDFLAYRRRKRVSYTKEGHLWKVIELDQNDFTNFFLLSPQNRKLIGILFSHRLLV